MIADHFGKTVNSHVDSALLSNANTQTKLGSKRAKIISSKKTGNDNSPRVVGQWLNILYNALTLKERNPKWRLERAVLKQNNFILILNVLKFSTKEMAVSRRELEELKPWVEQTVKQRLGFNEKTVVNAALYCVKNDLDRSSSREKLSSLLDDLAPQFVNDLFDKVSQLKSNKTSGSGRSSQAKKRTLEDVFGDDMGDDRTDMDSLKSRRKQSRFDALKEDNVPLPPAISEVTERPTPLSSTQISEMVASMKKQIEERKKQLNVIRQVQPAAAPPVQAATPQSIPFQVKNNESYYLKTLMLRLVKANKYQSDMED